MTKVLISGETEITPGAKARAILQVIADCIEVPRKGKRIKVIYDERLESVGIDNPKELRQTLDRIEKFYGMIKYRGELPVDQPGEMNAAYKVLITQKFDPYIDELMSLGTGPAITIPIVELVEAKQATPPAEIIPKGKPVIPEDHGEDFFILKGEYWEVGFQGETSIIQDLNNIRYIVQLLHNPGKEILASELQRIVSGIALDFNEEYSNKTEQEMNDEGMGTTGSRAVRTAQDNILDREIKQKAKKLFAYLEDAKKEGIPMVIEEAQEEYDNFINELQSGRNLKSNPDMEKARGNVKNHINRAIKNIKNAGLKELASYLAKRIHKGTKCYYTPDPDNPIKWEIKF